MLACLREWVALPVCFFVALAQADQVNMKNGDRFAGKVVSVATNTVILQSQSLGLINLAREQVASISFIDSSAPAATPVQASKAQPANAAGTTTNSQQKTSLGADINSHPEVIQQVQEQFLAGAAPEAQTKFNEMVNGLKTGKLNVND